MMPLRCNFGSHNTCNKHASICELYIYIYAIFRRPCSLELRECCYTAAYAPISLRAGSAHADADAHQAFAYTRSSLPSLITTCYKWIKWCWRWLTWIKPAPQYPQFTETHLVRSCELAWLTRVADCIKYTYQYLLPWNARTVTSD